ncbi:MAG TPA: ABC transporter permease [Xanthomonadales bacterium]|nr:ABC transporter permease [Xanthomonadales bacterium]
MIIEIRPPSGWPRLELGEVWRHLQIIKILAIRDIKVRYKQSIAGVGWAVVQPLFTVLVLTAIFSGIVKVPTAGVPFPLFAMCAMAPWLYFVHAITTTTSCLVANQTLITRVYFPRLLLPLSTVVSAMVDFLIAFTLLLIMLAWYGHALSAKVVLVPVFVAFNMLNATALGLWLSAMNVQYRDVFHALPFFTQILMFLSPVVYPASLIPEKWQWLYNLNPMATVIGGFRWVFLEGQPAPGMHNLGSIVVVTVALLGGLYFFRWQEDRFADVV